MADLKTYTCAKIVQAQPERAKYPQAIRVGDMIHVAGQNGRLPESTKGSLKRSVGFGYLDIPKEIDQAFENVDLALRAAGGKGWEQVYRVRSYHILPGDETDREMGKNFRKWMPTRLPVWTKVPLAKSPGGDPDDYVLIEVEAYDPEGARAAQ